MSTPKHTPLRHRMLREIAASGGAEFARYERQLQRTRYVSSKRNLSQGERDAVQWMEGQGLLQWLPWPGGNVAQMHRPLDANDTGRSLLAEWDAAHPDHPKGSPS